MEQLDDVLLDEIMDITPLEEVVEIRAATQRTPTQRLCVRSQRAGDMGDPPTLAGTPGGREFLGSGPQVAQAAAPPLGFVGGPSPGPGDRMGRPTGRERLAALRERVRAKIASRAQNYVLSNLGAGPC